MAGSTCYRGHFRVMWKQRCGSGNKDDSKKGDYTSDLLVASEWLMEEDRTGPASHDWGKEGDHRSV